MNCKNLFFDLDGTLTDSGEGIIHCAQQTLAHFSLPVPDKTALRIIVGPPLRGAFLKFGIDEAQLENAMVYFREQYLATGQYENFPYPGIQQLLQRLKDDGHRLFVATSKPETVAINILKRYELDGYFEVICGATMDHSRDTKTQVIEHLLTQLDTSFGVPLMIGDTVFDVEGAAALNIPTVGVTWGYGEATDLKNAGAVAIADSMDSLYQIISAD